MSRPVIRCCLGLALVVIGLADGSAVQAGQIFWIGGNANWDSTITRWNPNDEPDPDDEAIFNTSHSVNLANSSESILALTMSGGIDLYLNGNDLTVNGGNVTLSGASTLLDIPTNSTLNSDDVFVNADASLTMHGGTITMAQSVGDAVLTVAAGGAMGGFGTIHSTDAISVPNTTVFSLGGNLVVTSFDLFSQQAATLAINVPANGRVDLDQTNAVIDIARNDTLDINGAAHDPAVDAYSGTLNLAEGATLDMSNAWGMNSGSIHAETHGINVNTAGTAATIAGATFTQSGGTIDLADSLDSLRITANFTATGGSINNNGHMILHDATINGANFQMNGDHASLSVAGIPGPGLGHAVRITQGNFDLSGAGAETNVTMVGNGGFLWLEIDFDAGPFDVMDQSIELNGGALRVHNVDDGVAGSDTVWHLSNGVVNANVGANYLEGDDLIIQAETIKVDPGAELNINTSEAEVTNPTITIGGQFLINTYSRWTHSGASVSGTGVFRPGVPTIGDGATATDIVWNVTTVDWDDEAQVGPNVGTTVAAGSSLTINADAIETVPGDGYDATIHLRSGDLTVNTPTAWRMEHLLNIDNLTAIPTIDGARMIVGDADGATVNVGANGGVGVHNMNAPMTLEANGVVNVAGSAIFQVSGDTVFDGGQVTGDGSYLPAAMNTVRDDPSVSRIDVDKFQFDRGSWTIDPNASLIVDVGDYDPLHVTNRFTSTITIRENGALSVRSDDPTFLVDTATINMIGSVGGFATAWQGDAIEFGNDAGTRDTHLAVSGDYSHISAMVTFLSDADVTIDAGATLAITGALTNVDPVNGLNQASFTGDGTLSFNTELNFNEATTLNVGTVYLKEVLGVPSPFGRTVTVYADTTINADVMGPFGGMNNDGVDDVLAINGQARLRVNLANPNGEWTINAPAIVNMNASDAPLVGSGIDGADVNIDGTVNIRGNSVWSARVDIAGTVHTTLASDRFQLNGGTTGDENRLEGGSINGPGQLVLDAGHALVGHGTINSDILFLNVSTKVAADDGMLTIDGAFNGFPAGSTGTHDTDGILNVVHPWDSILFQSVNMAGGEIRGGTITNNTRLEGFGLVTARVINNSSIRAQGGGTLILETTGNDNDWDGANDFALLYAVGGNLELRDNAAFPFSGSVLAQSGREVFANGFSLQFEPASLLTLLGGTYRSTHDTQLGGTVDVAVGGPSTLQISGTAVFENGSSTTLNGDLLLANLTTVVETGATFSGGGRLTNLPGNTLQFLHGVAAADLAVLVDNQGVLSLGDGGAVGTVSATAYQQGAAGVFELDLGGSAAGESDQLSLTGQATLGGSLDLSLLLTYTPSVGHTIPVVSAAGGVTGTFAIIEQPAVMPTGLFFDVIYGPTLVQVKALPTGDLNGDGSWNCADVDSLVAQIVTGMYADLFDMNGDSLLNAADVTVWLGRAGAVNLPSGSSYLPGDGNLDGDVDGSDFSIWNSNKFTSNAAWCLGDFNADGSVDGSDFNVWNGNKFTSADSLNSVPEPCLAGFALAWLLEIRLRAKRKTIDRGAANVPYQSLSIAALKKESLS